MAEVLATMVVGPLVSMVNEKASSYFLEQYNVMEGLEEQHKLLKRRLPAILDVIADAEMQAAEHRKGAKVWLEEVMDVAYKANDVLDEFKYEALRRKAKKEGHYRELGMHFIKLFPTHNRIVFRYRMGNKLRMILQAIEILIAEKNDFQFKFQSQQQLSTPWRHTYSSVVDPMEIASRSRDQDKQKVVKILLGQEHNNNLIVLPIVGMGGLGKTTLAQLVYNDSNIQEHFELQLWVCVSDNFDVDFLAKSIVDAAGKSVTHGKPPLDSLREVVSGKRYLLVLDDVWNRDAGKWERLKSCLQHGGKGCSVLTTTRDKGVAQLMGPSETYELQSLGENFIEEIIKIKAFNSKETGSAELLKLVPEVAKRCAGSPLAATALGSLLRTKHKVEEWNIVLSKSTICAEDTEILPILKLSYNDLPSEMRQCFSFCALFPKDYDIDVEMLIQLWMANGFILEEEGVCLEIRGKQIFNELASRSFFQEVKEIPFGYKIVFGGFCYSRITCKIHDLMHDVAQSSMGNECATIGTEQSKTENLPYSTRHLFVSLYRPESILNGFRKERSSALQTLMCPENVHGELEFLSKYNSIRALRIQGHLSLKPTYLHHLRYLDLSRSDIETLPEDISILYHLQTLNLSDCRKLNQLPKDMKYMIALRHLYTDGCKKLKMMPPGLSCLASLRMLTCFVAGTSSSTGSDLAELGSLDLGGYIEILQMENVAENEAQAANLGNKKKLSELKLQWTTHPSTEPQHDPQKVMETLKPHEGIKALGIYGYGGNTYPTWINTLQHMVVLVLSNCTNLEKLPPLWQFPDLQVVRIRGIENLLCFSGGDPPFSFNKLKELELDEMPNFEAWWCNIDVVQGEELLFPKVEKLSISGCGKLTALPRASIINTNLSDRVNMGCRSAFPALKELNLRDLATFQRWEADEGSAGEQITTFPSLEELVIRKCPELTTLPDAPKLTELNIYRGSQQICQHAARYITSLSTLRMSLDETTDHCLIKPEDAKEMCLSCESSLRAIDLSRCDFWFPDSSAPTIWTCLVRLEFLRIMDSNVLVDWPEGVFRHLVSLRRLCIWECKKLTGCTKASEQGTPGQSVLPPCLEVLEVANCDALVEVPALPASLTRLRIDGCNQLESVIVRKQPQTTAGLGSSDSTFLTRQEKSQGTPGQSVLPPRLEVLEVANCDALVEVPVLPASLTRLHIHRCNQLESVIVRKQPQTTAGLGSSDSTFLTRQEKSALIGGSRTEVEAVPNDSPGISALYAVAKVPIAYMYVDVCSNLRSLSVQVDCTALFIRSCSRLESVDDLSPVEVLHIFDCSSLACIPDVPRVYNSLRKLRIRECPCLKVLPPCLKQRLNYIKSTDMDACYTGPKLSRPSTWKYAITRQC